MSLIHRRPPKLTPQVKKIFKHGWWIGIALGLACHFMPPEYHDACKAVVNACTP